MAQVVTGPSLVLSAREASRLGDVLQDWRRLRSERGGGIPEDAYELAATVAAFLADLRDAASALPGRSAVDRKPVVEWWPTKRVASEIRCTESWVKFIAAELGGVQDAPGRVWRFPSDRVRNYVKERNAA